MSYKILYVNKDASLWVAVDIDDYVWAKDFVWNYKRHETFLTTHYYVKRNIGVARTPVYLHVEIMRRQYPNDVWDVVDHISGNTLDCRKSNLRKATYKVNANNKYGKSFLLPILEEDNLCIPF